MFKTQNNSQFGCKRFILMYRELQFSDPYFFIITVYTLLFNLIKLQLSIYISDLVF